VLRQTTYLNKPHSIHSFIDITPKEKLPVASPRDDRNTFLCKPPCVILRNERKEPTTVREHDPACLEQQGSIKFDNFSSRELVIRHSSRTKKLKIMRIKSCMRSSNPPPPCIVVVPRRQSRSHFFVHTFVNLTWICPVSNIG
jgi:hypothetical protein